MTAETSNDGAAICMADFPVRSPGVNVIELSFDLQSVINAVKHEVEPACELGPHYYVTPESSDPLKKLYGISCELGRLLQLCSGQQNIREIVDVLSPGFAEIAGVQRKAVVLGLIKAAVQEGLVSIRPPMRPLSVDLEASSTPARASRVKPT
jgi:hypothetical protein